MKDYSYIIDEECTGTKSPELVRQIIPILIKWAKLGDKNKTYGDLNLLLGYKNRRFSGIGHQLGLINKVLLRLEEETGEHHIPTLNSLIKNRKIGLPSEGFSYVCPKYDSLDYEVKKFFVDKLNNEALNYKKWDWVLASLGLKPSVDNTDEAIIRSGAFSGGGEGPGHKILKEYIALHPNSIGLKTDENGVNEHILLSGDKLDVYFQNANVAIEVKPKYSPDSDILRGLFQCVKYKAILDSESAIHGQKPDGDVMLVIEGNLSDSNRIVKECLGIDVIENFKTNR